MKKLTILILLLISVRTAFGQLPDLIPYRSQSNGFGYADTNQKIVIQPQYERADFFKGEWALVSPIKNTINYQREEEPVFEDTEEVKLAMPAYNEDNSPMTEYALINKKGEILIPPTTRNILFDENNQIAITTEIYGANSTIYDAKFNIIYQGKLKCKLGNGHPKYLKQMNFVASAGYGDQVYDINGNRIDTFKQRLTIEQFYVPSIGKYRYIASTQQYKLNCLLDEKGNQLTEFRELNLAYINGYFYESASRGGLYLERPVAWYVDYGTKLSTDGVILGAGAKMNYSFKPEYLGIKTLNETIKIKRKTYHVVNKLSSKVWVVMNDDGVGTYILKDKELIPAYPEFIEGGNYILRSRDNSTLQITIYDSLGNAINKKPYSTLLKYSYNDVEHYVVDTGIAYAFGEGYYLMDKDGNKLSSSYKSLYQITDDYRAYNILFAVDEGHDCLISPNNEVIVCKEYKGVRMVKYDNLFNDCALLSLDMEQYYVYNYATKKAIAVGNLALEPIDYKPYDDKLFDAYGIAVTKLDRDSYKGYRWLVNNKGKRLLGFEANVNQNGVHHPYSELINGVYFVSVFGVNGIGVIIDHKGNIYQDQAITDEWVKQGKIRLP